MLRLDAQKDSALVQKAGVRGFPTLAIIDADGKELWKQAGYMETDPLKKAMEDALAKLQPDPQGK